ncbi:ATP-binding protein [Streptomyces sp. NBC_01803]|uniref:ATP-binding protein n=1 Tax=Streptomyces sp. NBC_01803 TaxID=2975946 RepID=UPI002DD88E3F|nr:ATP-binding protein [Streptomyces sp. NBC_01803]
MSRVRVWVVTCPGIPQELARARRFVREIFHSEPWADDAALIVTELGANAITHTDSAKTTFRLQITRSPQTVTISVTDNGGTATTPHVQHPAPDAQHGRGLALVTAHATTVHIRRDHTGHTVTAELDISDRTPPTP